MSGKRGNRPESAGAVRKRWIGYGREHLQGRMIVAVDYLSDAEARELDWFECPVVLTLDNGTQVMPWRDDEGNGAGALGGQTAAGEALLVPVLRRFP